MPNTLWSLQVTMFAHSIKISVISVADNTIFQMGNQIFHHGGLGGHQSVIHIVDSSGNQQPMNSVNPVDISANNVVNAAKPGGTLRKPGQPLTVQLDGADDDDDFVDLSDDEANPDSAGPPAKRLKPSKVTSERLEEVLIV